MKKIKVEKIEEAKIVHVVADNGKVVKKKTDELCSFHDLEFIGDGIWKCKDCRVTKTNNNPLTHS